MLDAQAKSPQPTIPDELQKHELLGFGSAIDTGKNYRELLDFADKLPNSQTRKRSSSQQMEC
ncbi:MAG: hypothetical protein ABSF44_12425 [Candidatus Bathyarchaeia archaeon]